MPSLLTNIAAGLLGKALRQTALLLPVIVSTLYVRQALPAAVCSLPLVGRLPACQPAPPPPFHRVAEQAAGWTSRMVELYREADLPAPLRFAAHRTDLGEHSVAIRALFPCDGQAAELATTLCLLWMPWPPTWPS